MARKLLSKECLHYHNTREVLQISSRDRSRILYFLSNIRSIIFKFGVVSLLSHMGRGFLTTPRHEKLIKENLRPEHLRELKRGEAPTSQLDPWRLLRSARPVTLLGRRISN